MNGGGACERDSTFAPLGGGGPPIVLINSFGSLYPPRQSFPFAGKFGRLGHGIERNQLVPRMVEVRERERERSREIAPRSCRVFFVRGRWKWNRVSFYKQYLTLCGGSFWRTLRSDILVVGCVATICLAGVFFFSPRVSFFGFSHPHKTDNAAHHTPGLHVSQSDRQAYYFRVKRLWSI